MLDPPDQGDQEKKREFGLAARQPKPAADSLYAP
jgi:hypothetical protein